MTKCKNTDCEKRASFGFEHNKADYCSKHKEQNMFLVTVKLCQGENCKRYPHYNIQGESNGIYCIAHKLENMKVVGTLCIVDTCKNIAKYNLKNIKRQYCEHHKTGKMVESGKNICQTNDCLITAIYGNIGKKATQCVIHKETQMIDLFHKTCIFEGCCSRPSYGLSNENTALYCAKHKSNSMIDNIHTKCRELFCTIVPSFNFEGQKQRLYCSHHAKDGMINISAIYCIFEGCQTHPCYNYEGQTRRLYCKEHQLENMIDISYKCCEHEGCKTRPIFNYKSEKQGQFCKKHRHANMIDVINSRCEYDECEISPTHNYRGETKRRFCSSHQLPDMINISAKHCKTPLCETRASTKYEGLCLRCFIYTFPEKPVSRNYKTKEHIVADEILKSFSQFTWIADKRIQDGCSRRRPDLIMDMGSHVIIIEIDENQHNDYDTSCENRRIMEISQDIGHRPVVFIRFNPDDYIDETDTKVRSCFTTDKNGITKVAKAKQTEWNNRINCLKSHIQYWSEQETEKTVEIVHLFFDLCH